MHRILHPGKMAFPYTLPVGWLAIVDTSSTVGRMAIMDRSTHLSRGYRLDGETGDWAICPDFMFQRRDDIERSIRQTRAKAQGVTVCAG